MKGLVGFFLAGIAAVAFAQTGRIEPAAPAAEALAFVDIEQLPIAPPPEQLEMLLAPAEVAADGFSRLEKSPRHVTDFMHALIRVRLEAAWGSESIYSPQRASGWAVYTDLAALRLAFKPTAFEAGELIGATVEGWLAEGGWPGLERYFHMSGAGDVCLSEADVPGTEAGVYFPKNLVNASVNGKPAVSTVFTGRDGPIMEEIIWGSGRKIYKLTYLPLVEGTDRTKAGSVISAYSLAQRVR